ncbi:hypothetical protein O7632_01535 [Solwaraspora sp. WMMD406]|uniref:hypothetical protein n=1 Tax=Solwaraspora sp. WMMD406 TaxID=3016095 RepID=UPI0024174FB5|nr:hypothetical protein [Solwaraspora sp. WMMD406]MDG4762804.1 hypothetical protein [Solwaraspora sp. WMMD406]
MLVERLLVPTRPYTVNAAATPRAAEVWDRIAKAAGPPATPAPARGIFDLKQLAKALDDLDV